MKIEAIRDIECAILHDRYAPISGQSLFDLVRGVVKSLGLATELQGGLTDEYGISASVDGLHILVSQNAQPLGSEGFVNVLAQPITKFAMPDADARVARHKANTFITVSKGLHMPPQLLRAVNEYLPGLTDKSDTFDDHTKVLSGIDVAYKIAIAVQRQVSCSALHWCMCDQLVTPEFMEAVGKGPTLTPLCVRPNLFSSSNRVGPGLPLGMVVNGAQYLIGRPIVFKEAAVELPWMLERVANFIDMAHLRGNVVEHGGSFGVSNDEIISVSHTPSSRDYPLGTYTLTASHVPQFGIVDSTRPVSSEPNRGRVQVPDGEAKLNPNDPIDRLILDRLEERRQLEDRRVAEDRRVSSGQFNEGNDRRGASTFGRRTTPFGRRT
jgi:hypothetical protein